MSVSISNTAIPVCSPPSAATTLATFVSQKIKSAVASNVRECAKLSEENAVLRAMVAESKSVTNKFLTALDMMVNLIQLQTKEDVAFLELRGKLESDVSQLRKQLKDVQEELEKTKRQHNEATDTFRHQTALLESDLKTARANEADLRRAVDLAEANNASAADAIKQLTEKNNAMQRALDDHALDMARQKEQSTRLQAAYNDLLRKHEHLLEITRNAALATPAVTPAKPAKVAVNRIPTAPTQPTQPGGKSKSITKFAGWEDDDVVLPAAKRARPAGTT